MSIPDKPLQIKQLDLDQLTLAENRLLFGRTYNVDKFYQFLIDNSNWTEEEAGQITRAELDEVHLQVTEKVCEQATPLAKSPPSGDGPG